MRYKLLHVIIFSLFYVMSGSAQSITLLSPQDELISVASYPTFSWQLIGSAPAGLTYTFKIAEYNASIGDVASLGSPLYTEVITDNSNFITYNYPTNLQPLDTCKSYVWQVTASYTTYTTEEPIVPLQVYNFSSDYFHFSSTCNSINDNTANRTTTPQYPIYIKPVKAVDNFVYLITTDSLYFKYDEVYNRSYNNYLPYRIYTTDDNVALSGSLQVNYGLNYLAIDITSSNVLLSPKIYTLEIKTPKGELLRTKFEKKPL